jgi:transcriptional regulator with XRE-family HTH domain
MAKPADQTPKPVSETAQGLKRVREAKGWSQGRLAAELGVSQVWVSRRETGEVEPDRSDLIAWYKACDALPPVGETVDVAADRKQEVARIAALPEEDFRLIARLASVMRHVPRARRRLEFDAAEMEAEAEERMRLANARDNARRAAEEFDEELREGQQQAATGR